MEHYKFSSRSRRELYLVDRRLQTLCTNVLRESPIDFTITEGYRDEARQNAAYYAGNSQVKYPNGKHNKNPSLAIDFLPYPNGYGSQLDFCVIAWYFKEEARKMGLNIRWGGDWDGDLNMFEEKFWDAGHIELI